MAAAALTFAFLIYQVNSQVVLGPTYSIPRVVEPTTQSGTEVCRSSVSVGTDPGVSIQTSPNVVPITNIIPLNQPCFNVAARPVLNLPAPSCIQNQVLINQQAVPVLSTKPVVKSSPPKCTNVQVSPICKTTQQTPSVIANPELNTPVVAVVDNTLANSLANALQLLIISNLLENSETSNAGNPPCINNYEIVTPDFNVPACSCEYFTNMVYPESAVSISEPVFSCPEPVFSCSEPVFSCPEQIFSFPEPVFTCSEPAFSCPQPVVSCPQPVVSCPDPVIYQTYPTNFGGPIVIDSSGFQCGQNNVFLETPTQYVTPKAPCSEPIAPMPSIPAVATIAPLALEVPFPSSIPAQLICNFGLSPSNQPCVTYSVEPCNNLFTNFI